MDVLEISTSAVESLKINRLRSILTALGIIIGVAAIIILISISTGLQNFISGQFERLGTNSIFVLPGRVRPGPQGGPPRSVNKLTFNIADHLKKQKGEFITEVSPLLQLNVNVTYKNKNKITVLIGAENSYFENTGLKQKEGRVFSENENQSAQKVAVIGEAIAYELYGQEHPLTKSVLVSKKSFRIIGILEPQGNVGGIDVDNQVIIPLLTAKKLTGTDQVNSILIKTTSAETLPQAKAQVEKILKRNLSEDDFTILTQEQLLSSILQILGVLTLALGGIAAISLIVGGVGISNIMLVSVTERTREIGLRKAVGAKQQDILGQFLVEAAILSLFGGIIGIIVGYLSSMAISSFIRTAVPIWAIFLGIGFSMTVGIIFGIAPAIRAARLEPISALKHE